MKFVSLLLLIPFLLGLLCVPWGVEGRFWRKHGPLYESVKLLINVESMHATEVWNATREEIYAHAYLLERAQDELQALQKSVDERLDPLFNTQHSEEMSSCFKTYELEVAHFNRELISLHNLCKLSLEHLLEHFELEVLEETNFLSEAANQMAELSETCHVERLRRDETNQEGVLLCTVAGIGRINLRMASAIHVCADIMMELTAPNGEQLETQSCSGYKQLKSQFDEVYEQIEMCVLQQ